jgi:trk system potassium uptake protein TrkH
MMIPAFYALMVGEKSAAMAFMNSSVALFFLAGGLIFALYQERLSIARKQQLLIVLGIWFLLPLGAGLPYYLTGSISTFSGAYFEAVSGFTTTGLSLIKSQTDVPKSILMWRAVLQWLGGLTTLLMLSFIIGRIMGIELFGRDTRSIIQSNSGSSMDLENTVATILPLYLGLTVACFILLILFGIPSFDAFCLSLSTLSTGGYMPREGSISLYGSPLAELTLAIFMFIGAVSVIWVKALIERNRMILLRTNEPLWIGLAILVFGLILSGIIISKTSSANYFSILHSLTLGIASAASLITTTGFIFGSHDQFVFPYLLLLTIAIIGGGRYSTAGGLKFSRILTMLDLSKRELQNLLYPHGIHPTLHGNKNRDQSVRRSIWSIFSITILFLVAMILTLSYFGVPLNAALMVSVSSFGNFGPAYDLARPANPELFPTVAAMGAKVQFVLGVGMIIGRVETLIILGLLNLAIWRK